MRLDKFLADMGEGSRSQAKEIIRKGRVLLNGKIIKNPEEKVTDTDEVFVDQKQIVYTAKEYFMLYKPTGVLSASKDRRTPTVLDLITEKKRKDLFPVGRLDKDTEGLLLITNDGMLAHKLLSPHNHVPKVYFVKVNGVITEEIKQQFQTGIVMDQGELALPANIKILSCKQEESEAELTIYEGKFHQVKRMFAAVGLMVTYLKRLSMGSLILDESLGKGGFRPLSRKEIEELKG